MQVLAVHYRNTFYRLFIYKEKSSFQLWPPFRVSPSDTFTKNLSPSPQRPSLSLMILGYGIGRKSYIATQALLSINLQCNKWTVWIIESELKRLPILWDICEIYVRLPFCCYLVAHLCLALLWSHGGSAPGSSVHGISLARILE